MAPAQPLVTIVMAAWNPRPDWLLEAVHSALAQRGVDFELVVVDDGSDTPLRDVLSGIEDPRLRIVRVDHGGASHARNAGVAAARGELIRFVDADDVLEPDSTARLAALLGERRDEIAYGATLVCDAELRPEREIRSSVQGDALRACLLDGFEVRVPSMLFPRDVVVGAGPWPEELRVTGDWDFVLRTLERAHVRGDQQIAMRYRRHGSSLTADVEAGENGCRTVIDRYFQRHPEQRGSPLEREARARVALIFARAWVAQGDRRRAVRLLLEAARLRPRTGLAAAARMVPSELIRGLRRRTRRNLEWLALNMPPARRLRIQLAREELERRAGDGELRVLDAGCEIGLFAIDVARRHPGWRVAAVDVDAQSLAEARRLAAERSVSGIEFVEADLTQPLPLEGYDAVVVLEAFGEIPDHSAAARTLARSLRRDGVLLAHVAMRDWKPVLRGSRTHWKAAERSGYTAEEITRLLEGAGLEVCSIEPTLRGTAHLAQELRERVKSKPLRVRAALSPLMAAAVRLERARLTWGEPRGMFVIARRPG